VKYRHLSRDSAHRKALLRNLVTSLFEHETISTTWPKAKEAQRLAEKLITLAKKNTSASRRRAHQIFFVSTYLTLHHSVRHRSCEATVMLIKPAFLLRNPSKWSPNSSARFVNATSHAPAAAPASYALSL